MKDAIQTSTIETNNITISIKGIELRHQIIKNCVRLFLIQTPQYGTTMSVYQRLFDKAKEYFPDLSPDIVQVGVVSNTGHMDHFAVICFQLSEGREIPEDFKKLAWQNHFRW